MMPRARSFEVPVVPSPEQPQKQKRGLEILPPPSLDKDLSGPHDSARIEDLRSTIQQKPAEAKPSLLERKQQEMEALGGKILERTDLTPEGLAEKRATLLDKWRRHFFRPDEKEKVVDEFLAQYQKLAKQVERLQTQAAMDASPVFSGLEEDFFTRGHREEEEAARIAQEPPETFEDLGGKPARAKRPKTEPVVAPPSLKILAKAKTRKPPTALAPIEEIQPLSGESALDTNTFLTSDERAWFKTDTEVKKEHDQESKAQQDYEDWVKSFTERKGRKKQEGISTETPSRVIGKPSNRKAIPRPEEGEDRLAA
jgi:hypothetical protein